MEFQYNREQSEVINVLKRKAEKKNLDVTIKEDKVEVCLKPGKFKNGEDYIPVTFRGKLNSNGNRSSLKGGFYYGFYLYTLVIVAALLIVARFVWSAVQGQQANMILCGIVTILLLIVVVVVFYKSKNAKKMMTDCLSDLNVK